MRGLESTVGLLLVIAAGAVAVAVGGCGGSSSAPSDAGADASSAATLACAAEEHALCELRSSCSMGYLINLSYADEPTCESRGLATCIAATEAKGSANTVAHVQGCAAAYPMESCSDYIDGNPVMACVPPAGTLQTGAACGASGQCASTFCAVPQYQVCGTCQPLPAAGASCQVAADCGRNMACATPTGATSGKCSPYAAMGAACLTGAQPCSASLVCVGDDETTGAMGTCQAAVATMGGACDGTRKTMPSCYADIGLVCIPSAKGSAVGTCQAIQLAAAGSPCGDLGSAPITGFAECTGGGLCAKPLTDAGTAATSGTCVAPAADGAACSTDPTSGPPCLPPAKCVVSADGGTAGTCTVADATKCM